VGNERKIPTDRGGCDPQIRVVEALVESVTDQAALVAKLRDCLDRLVVHRYDADAASQLRKLPDPSRAPRRLQRSVSRLGDRLRRHCYTLPEDVLGVLRRELRPLL
jgi:hypothetical protein